MDKELRFTVSSLTSLIKESLENTFYGLTVEGEISGFKNHFSGHWYFNLKDSDAVIKAVVWRSATANIGFIPSDGEKVVVKGNITVYPPQGSYQLVCTSMRKEGLGDILAELERRKRYYEKKGYFDISIKKPIPSNPSKIAVITSAQGAALQDILNITKRRSNADIVVLSAAVQGDGADETIAKRIVQVNKYRMADVIIVGRGGGSIEDLLPFSSEKVIEAIHNSEIPVISAVGHEVDWALSDYVADLRAPTPSAAAELVCRDKNEQIGYIRDLKDRLSKDILTKLQGVKLRVSNASINALKYRLTNKIGECRMDVERLKTLMHKRVSTEIMSGLRLRFEKTNTKALRYVIDDKIRFLRSALSSVENSGYRIDDRIRSCKSAVVNAENMMNASIKDFVRPYKLRLEGIKIRLPYSIDECVSDYKKRLSVAKTVIEASGAQVDTILKRGFSIVRDENGKVVKSVDDIEVGSNLKVRFAKGEAETEVVELIRDAD